MLAFSLSSCRNYLEGNFIATDINAFWYSDIDIHIVEKKHVSIKLTDVGINNFL